MTRVAALTLVALLTATLALAAQAKGIVSEIQYYKDITVVFSENARGCGLKDPAPIEQAVAKRLSGLDIRQNSDAEASVFIGVTAAASGFLAQRCIAYLDLQLRADLQADFIDRAATQNGGQIFTVMNQRGYVFPVIFFQAGSIFANLQPAMAGKTLEAVDLLMQQLADARRAK
tara:strand:+ start:3147 stop:3668 length:522 start_codon:yes stop_codon:yes gene_type:complete